jgi:hypothetical protein
VDEEVHSEELPQGLIPDPKTVSLSLPQEQPFTDVIPIARKRRFNGM